MSVIVHNDLNRINSVNVIARQVQATGLYVSAYAITENTHSHSLLTSLLLFTPNQLSGSVFNFRLLFDFWQQNSCSC